MAQTIRRPRREQPSRTKQCKQIAEYTVDTSKWTPEKRAEMERIARLFNDFGESEVQA